jgi:hypothetical protein
MEDSLMAWDRQLDYCNTTGSCTPPRSQPEEGGHTVTVTRDFTVCDLHGVMFAYNLEFAPTRTEQHSSTMREIETVSR